MGSRSLPIRRLSAAKSQASPSRSPLQYKVSAGTAVSALVANSLLVWVTINLGLLGVWVTLGVPTASVPPVGAAVKLTAGGVSLS